MSNYEVDKTAERPTGASRNHSGLLAVLGAGLVLALAGDGFLLVRSNQLKDHLARTQDTQTQISKLGDATTALLQQRLETINGELKAANESAESALKRARSDAQRQSRQLAQRLDTQQQQVSGELTQLKDATSTAATKLNEVSTDVSGVKAEVASTQTELEKHGTELKRVVGDMGVMSGLIATNSKDLVALRELGDRNYIEFTLNKRESSKKVGDLMLTLKKADPKRSRYTVEVLADDKRLEKRDKTINEPVQLYVSGNRQPYEIVINEVKKDQVMGYLATPKVKMARR